MILTLIYFISKYKFNNIYFLTLLETIGLNNLNKIMDKNDDEEILLNI